MERRATGDRGFHNVLDRPRDAPRRTAFGLAFFTWVALIFLAGSADRVTVLFGLSYPGQIWFFRVFIWAAPIAVYLVARRVCVELVRAEQIEEDQERAEEEAAAALHPGPASSLGGAAKG